METVDLYKSLYKIDALLTVAIWMLIVLRAHLQLRYDRLTGEDTWVFPGVSILLALIPVVDIGVLVYILLDIAVIRKDIQTHYFRLLFEEELDSVSRKHVEKENA